jgi:MoxR-like ATPase
MKLTETKRAIKLALELNRPLFMWGGIGIGKTSLIQSFEPEWTVRKMILTYYEPVQVRGFAIPDEEKRQMVWYPSEDLPVENRPTILFLDELNLAPPSTQRAIYQLILEGRVGSYTLPPTTRIIAAGNRNSDKTGVYGLLPALANRFLHVEVDPDLTLWVQWAKDNQIHTDIVAFLLFKQDLFWKPELFTSFPAFPTPRSWAFASAIYSQTGNPDDIALAVGPTASAGFKKFLDVRANLPMPPELFQTKVNDPELLLSSFPIVIKYLIENHASIKTAAQWLNTIQPDFAMYFLQMAPNKLGVKILKENQALSQKVKKYLFYTE